MTDERTAIRRAAQASDEAKAAQSAAFNAQAALLRLRQENQYLADRCARLEAFASQLSARVAEIEHRLGGG